jgi:hypothetical protein
MAFSREAKAAWRARPEVKAKQAAYKANWDAANRHERAAYQRAWRARHAPVSALNRAGATDTAPAPVTRTAGHDSAGGQMGLFDATNN